MATNDIRPVVDWLVDGARSTMQAHGVLAELCDRLVGCGIPLWRVAVFVRTLHPHIMGRRFVWRMQGAHEYRHPPRFTPAGCLFGGASRTPIARWIFQCSRSCATMGSRTIWPRRCYSPMARFIWQLGPRGSRVAS